VVVSDDDTFALLLDRLHAGEDATAQHVFELFAGGLVALVRRGFNHLLARKMDSGEDVSGRSPPPRRISTVPAASLYDTAARDTSDLSSSVGGESGPRATEAAGARLDRTSGANR
jgi:hypothetical protein